MKQFRLLFASLVVLLLTSAIPDKRTTIFVIGDSTAANKDTTNGKKERGWAMMLQGCFDANYIVVDNHAVNGRSSKSFINEGRWDKVLEKIKPGDYVIIQFGHNDEKAQPDRHTDPGTTFDANLEKYISETRQRGGIPVLMNCVVRRNFFVKAPEIADDELLHTSAFKDGVKMIEGDTLIDTHGLYKEAPKHVARKTNCHFIDANKITHDLEQGLGREESKKLHMWFLPGTEPSEPKGKQDNTHYNIYGATTVANLLADALCEEIPTLIKYRVKKTVTTVSAFAEKPWSNGRLKVSANQRFLQFENGKPFFWLGETAWLMPERLNRDEVALYLKKCNEAGYNMVQVQVLNGVPSFNAYGTPSHNKQSRLLTDVPYSYWDHLDYIVDVAAQNNIYIGMASIWGSLVKAGKLSVEQAKTYGSFLANRYKDRPNIIWIMGGDIQGDIKPEVWETLATTIKSIDKNHLMTYHPRGRYTSAHWWNKASWIDFHCFQSGHRRYGQRMGNKDYPIPDNTEEDTWHNAPITIWINTTMRIPIAPQGWTNMGAIPKLFAEYGSHDEKGNLLDLSQRKTAYEYTIRPTGDKVSGQRTTTISKQDADSLYTYQNMICSNDGWNPRQLMLQLPAPSKVRITRHQISWEPVINAIGYLVTDDNENVIAITKKCRCNINDSSKRYRVRSISESGSIGL